MHFEMHLPLTLLSRPTAELSDTTIEDVAEECELILAL
jgi:hypothetical protein